MKKQTKYTIAWCMAWVVVFVVLLLIFGCSGSKEIEKEYIHDTTRVVDVRYDSVDRWHTHYEYVLGDTIRSVDSFYFDRWHLRTDTVERSVVEFKDREVVKIEERKVYVWWPFAILAALLIAVFEYLGVMIRKEKKITTANDGRWCSKVWLLVAGQGRPV